MNQSHHQQLQHHPSLRSIRSIIKSKLLPNHNHHQQQQQQQQQQQPQHLHPQHLHPQPRKSYSTSTNGSPQFETDQSHDFTIVNQSGSSSSDCQSISNLSFNRNHLHTPISPASPSPSQAQAQVQQAQHHQHHHQTYQNSHHLQAKANIPRSKLNNPRPSLPTLPGLPSQARSPTNITTTGPKILKLDHHIQPLSPPSFINSTHGNNLPSLSTKPIASLNSQLDQVLQSTNSKLPSPHGSTFIRSTPSLPKLGLLPSTSLEPRPVTQQTRPSRPYPGLPTFLPPNAIKITPISAPTPSEPHSALDTITTTSEPSPDAHADSAIPAVNSITTDADTHTAVHAIIPTSDSQTAVDVIIPTSGSQPAVDVIIPTSDDQTAVDVIIPTSGSQPAVDVIIPTSDSQTAVDVIIPTSGSQPAVDVIVPTSDSQTAVDTLIFASDAIIAVDPTITTSDIIAAAIDERESNQSSSIPISLPVSSPATLNEPNLSLTAASPPPSILEQPISPTDSHHVQLASPFGFTTPKSRTNSEDLAEARKIILGLQLQVDGLKQQQQLPPSPALSTPPNSHLKKRFSDALLPTRPISPPDGGIPSKRHSVDATVVAPSSPRFDSDSFSLSDIQPSLRALLSPNLQSSMTRSSGAGSSPKVMSPKLSASTSTQSSLVTTSPKSLNNSTRSLTSPRTRSRDTSFSGRHDIAYVRARNMSSARHELIERLSIASSRSGITPSELEPQIQENVDEAFRPAHHRSQPSHTSQASIERFGTPESSPPWACPNDSSHDPPARPALATRPQPQLRSKAGRRWQQVGDARSAGREHVAQRSISSLTTSSAAHRALSPRPPSSPPTVSRGTHPFGSLHHDRKHSTFSSLGSPLTDVQSPPSIHSLFSSESQQPRQKHGSWFTDVPPSSASRPKFRPSVNSRGLLPSAHRQDTFASTASPLDQRPSSVQSSYVDANAPSPSLSSTATTISTSISLPSLAEVRTMSKLDVFLIASKLASELDSATRRFGIEKEALLEALNESRGMCDQLRQLCESELNGPNEEFRMKSNSRGGEEVLRERVEMLEVENSRLEIRANAMANELKRAVVDLRVAGEKTGSVLKASRIPRRSGSLVRSGSKMSLQSENQWRNDEVAGHNDYEETSTQYAELDQYRFQPDISGMDEVAEEENEEEEEDMHLSDHETQLEERESGRAGSPASTILASRNGDEEDDDMDWIHSVHNRISLGASSGESNIGWRLRPEDELFLQDLDEEEFDGVAADLARGNDEESLFALS